MDVVVRSLRVKNKIFQESQKTAIGCQFFWSFEPFSIQHQFYFSRGYKTKFFGRAKKLKFVEKTFFYSTFFSMQRQFYWFSRFLIMQLQMRITPQVFKLDNCCMFHRVQREIICENPQK